MPLEGHVNRAQRVKYYDELLEKNTELVMRGLPPTDEYMRLDYLTGKLLAHDEQKPEDDDTAIAAEVLEFLCAFERLLGPALVKSISL